MPPLPLALREPAAPAASPSAAQPAQPSQSVAPPIDMKRLEDELWRSFQKRARIERERRGRM